MKKILLLLMAVSFALSNSLKVGSTLTEKEFKDQFEKKLKVTENTKELIVAFSKDTGESVKKFLDKNKGYLQKNSSVYIADMSQVPSFVMNLFMLPKFEDYSYKMGLIFDEKKAEYFPKKEDKITVIKLNNLKVEKIDFVSELR